jgi:hypothetical protein
MVCQAGDLLDRFGVHSNRDGAFGPISNVLHLKLVIGRRRYGSGWRRTNDLKPVERQRDNLRWTVTRRRPARGPAAGCGGDRTAQRLGRHRLPQEIGRTQSHGVNCQLD